MNTNNSVNPTILVANHSIENLDMISGLLAEKDCVVLTAQGYNEAKECLKTNKIDLFILEVHLGFEEKSGLGLCKEIKSMEDYNQMSIIFLSWGNFSEREILEAYKAGASDFLIMPIKNEILKAKICLHANIVKTVHGLSIANKMNEKLFSIVSHDLINPFHSSLGLSELLISEGENFSEMERISMYKSINNSLSSAFSLLSSLLDWSRSQRKKLSPRFENLIVKNIIKEVLSELQSLAEEKRISFTDRTFYTDLVYSDSVMLSTILRNLLANAIKFSFKENSIEIYSKKNSKYLSIYVRDFGLGIDLENPNRLFDPDFDYSTTGTNNETGTGIGLKISSDFSRILNCNISFSPNIEQGTEVEIQIPEVVELV